MTDPSPPLTDPPPAADPGRTRARALVVASHPGPSVVVTVVVVGLGVGAGLGLRDLGLLAGAILLGQLSIGWSNDWIDGRAGRDAGRSDKPVATGALTPAALRVAALVVLLGCVATSAALGLRAALLHLVAVAGGWAYNAGLKATPLSVLPYLVSFALLPAIAAATAGGRTPAWALLAAGLFGAGVHLANALPDLAQDDRTGVQGLPQRLGPRRSAVGAGLLLGTGAVVALTARAAGAGWSGLLLAGGALVAALVGLTLVQGLRGADEAAFRAAMATGLLLVVVLVASGGTMLR